jgi:hypothetical protein
MKFFFLISKRVKFLVIKSLDPDLDPHRNQCGSTTLVASAGYRRRAVVRIRVGKVGRRWGHQLPGTAPPPQLYFLYYQTVIQFN